jgi:3-dehydroquinate synthetase
VNVNTNHTLPYPIHVGRGLLAVLPTLVSQVADAHHIGIIADETVAPLYGARLRAP